MPYRDPDRQRASQRERHAATRANYLIDKSCLVCGSTERLEIDHIDPSLKVSHRIWTWSTQRREAELAKCQVLCVTHHRAKTFAQAAHHSEHGTHSKYSEGCRCIPCREAQRDYMRAWRAA